MIASRRGLVALAVIALVLVAVVAIDPGGREPVRSRFLAPGLDPTQVDSLTWEGDVRVERRDGTWTVVSPQIYAVDDAAIDRVLTALRGARWQRRADVSVAGAIRSTLTVGAGERRWTIDIGAPLEGSGETWLVVDGAALLVEDWVADAIDLTALPSGSAAGRAQVPASGPSLRRVMQAHPFRGGFGKQSLAVHRLDGGPDLAIDLATGLESAPLQLRVDPARIANLVAALETLEIEPIADPGSHQPPPPNDAARRAILLELGPRPDRVMLGTPCRGFPREVAISSKDGDACVAAEAFERVRAAALALTGDASAIIDRRPYAGAHRRLVLVDGTTIELGKRAMIGTQPAYAPGVDAVLAALTEPAAIASLPDAPPRSQLEVDGIELDLFDHRLLARHGEPVALQPSADAWLRITSTRLDVRGRITWLEDPATISAVVVDGVIYRRGAVLHEWLHEPEGKAPAAVDALVELLAQPAEQPQPPPALASPHHIDLTVTPPGGAPYHHTFELGGHCAIRTAGEAVAVAPALCAALAEVAR